MADNNRREYSSQRPVAPGRRPHPLPNQRKRPDQGAGWPQYSRDQGHRMGRPDATAARRAARSSLAQKDAYRGYQPNQRPHSETEQLPGANPYFDSLFEDDVPDQTNHEPFSLRMKIALGAGIALVLVLILVFILRGAFHPDDSNVRLERRTSGKRGPMETVAKTTPETTTKPVETTPEETLPPVGTDPYQNPPSWVPPTQAPTPPQVDQPIAETLPPQDWNAALPSAVEEEPTTYEENEPGLWESVPEVTEAPQPQLPPAIGQGLPIITEAGAAQYHAGPTSPPALPPTQPGETMVGSPPPVREEEQQQQISEDQILTLPDPVTWDDVRSTKAVSGQVLQGNGSFWLLQPVGNGQFTVQGGEGNYTNVYASKDHARVIARTADDQYFLYSAGSEPQPLEVSNPQGLEQLVGDQGFAYISDGQLYYQDYQTRQLNVVAPNVTAAIISAQGDQFLLVADAGVRIQDIYGQSRDLLPSYTSTGNLQLDYFSDDGEIAIFQDDLNVYVYNPRLFGEDLLRIGKINPGSPADIIHLDHSSEFMIQQPGIATFIRVTNQGNVEQIVPDNGVIGNQAFVLSAGPASQGAYANVVLVSQDTLYLANGSTGGGGKYQAATIYQGLDEIVTAGNSIYWTNHDGMLFVLDSRVDLTSPETAISEISHAGVSELTASIDGSAIYYVKNNTLWQRQNNTTALPLASNVSFYLMNTDASRIYVVHTDGSLGRLQGGLETELAPAGSISGRESFAMNPMQEQGGNSWLDGQNLAWISNGQIYTE